MKITLMTGGAAHYDAGLLSGLVKQNLSIEVIGAEGLENSPLAHHPRLTFLNVYGRGGDGNSLLRKVALIAFSYARLIRYVVRTDSEIFHIQWPYKLVYFDRTVLLLLYKALGKKVVFTAHNIDAAARDGCQSILNRISLWMLYRWVDRIIVHTKRMKDELIRDYSVESDKIAVIPHGIMNAVPESAISCSDSRGRLDIPKGIRVLLFFGLITPYKGLELLIEAMSLLPDGYEETVLVVAGKIKNCSSYWNHITGLIQRLGLSARVKMDLRHIPDPEVELLFKAADVLVMPYRTIFQSGVIFLSYRFGLPVIATDVGSFKEDIIEGETGLVCKANDPRDIANKLVEYFDSPLWADLENRRKEIREYAQKRYSWETIGAATTDIYTSILSDSCAKKRFNHLPKFWRLKWNR